MKTGLWTSLLGTLRSWLDRWWFTRAAPVTILYPRDVEELMTILAQARDNRSSLKIVGGDYHVTQTKEDIIVSLRYMDRLLGLDTSAKTVTVEPGMKVSTLSSILATINLSVDLAGRVPDLTITDCLAVGGPGLGCGGAGLGASVISVQVISPGSGGEVLSWNWDNHTRQMAGLMGGLGLVAAVVSVTLQCYPLVLVTEISYLTSVKEVMETWHMVHRSSDHQQLTWFPFSEFAIITHTSGIDKLSLSSCQSRVNIFLTEASEWLANIFRRINLNCLSSLSMLSCVLARVQFISLWTAARHRSDHAHRPAHFLSSSTEAMMRGATWLLPLDTIPPLLHNISTWSQHYPGHVTSPIFIQTLHDTCHDMTGQVSRSRTSSVGSSHHRMSGAAPQGVHGQGYLCPRIVGCSGPLATLWYDWFLPETSPDPLQVSQLEELFHQVGGVKCWTGERLVSPLLLCNTHPQYRDWCRVKLDQDPDCVLESGYVQGTVFSRPSSAK